MSPNFKFYTYVIIQTLYYVKKILLNFFFRISLDLGSLKIHVKNVLKSCFYIKEIIGLAHKDNNNVYQRYDLFILRIMQIIISGRNTESLVLN
jgi:hypothetical protein